MLSCYSSQLIKQVSSRMQLYLTLTEGWFFEANCQGLFVQGLKVVADLRAGRAIIQVVLELFGRAVSPRNGRLHVSSAQMTNRLIFVTVSQKRFVSFSVKLLQPKFHCFSRVSWNHRIFFWTRQALYLLCWWRNGGPDFAGPANQTKLWNLSSN